MATFSAAEVINKTLIAKTRIPVYYDASDTADPFGYVSPGQPVGVVYAWLNPGYNRSGLWWMFHNSAGVPYYTPHKEGIFDVNSLKQQGAVTTNEKIRAAEMANLPWYEQLIRKYGLYVLAVPVIGYIVPPLLKRK